MDNPARPQRLVLLLPDLTGGGTQRVVLSLAKHLDRERFVPEIVAIDGRGSFAGAVPPAVRSRDLGKRRAWGLGWFRRLVGDLRTGPPDAVVSFLWYANAAAVLARRKARGTMPLLLSERASLSEPGAPVALRLMRRLAIRRLYGSADGLIANSERLGDELREVTGRGDGSILVLPNPVDLERVRAAASAAVPPPRVGSPIVSCMGRLVRQKGVDLAIRAVALSENPDLRLEVLGDGPDRARLRRIAEAEGVASRVEFLGFRPEPFAQLARATIFALPSRYEGFPNALVEAMALGLPCVASRCPTGPEEIVSDGVDGLLIPTEDPVALARAIDRLVADASLRTTLGRNAATRVERYDAARVTRRFEAVLDSALAGARGRSPS